MVLFPRGQTAGWREDVLETSALPLRTGLPLDSLSLTRVFDMDARQVQACKTYQTNSLLEMVSANPYEVYMLNPMATLANTRVGRESRDGAVA